MFILIDGGSHGPEFIADPMITSAKKHCGARTPALLSGGCVTLAKSAL